MNVRARRAAENENLFRRINERVETLVDGHDVLPILCECADSECVERLSVGRADYERVREQPSWFFVAPGHGTPEVEAVVEHGPGWEVVAKTGHAGRVAREDDPRSE